MFYRWLIRPLLYLLPAERAHDLAIALLRLAERIPGKLAAWRSVVSWRSPRLKTEALGISFPNPIGIAAGFDKNAQVFEPLAALGFGFVEVGTLTGQAQPGNARPRLFRLPQDRALINRLGFNNCGAEAAQERLCAPRRAIVGVNIGKTKLVPDRQAIEDYVLSARTLTAHADYLVINVSSPNTPGLRDLQAVSRLKPLILAVKFAMAEASQERRVPLLVKIAPDLADEDIDAIADMAVETGLDGLIATNTTISRDGLQSALVDVEACGEGGLSGAPLHERSLVVLERLYARVGKRLTLISVGGVENADQVWERICAGATLVQVYTAFVYQGPFLARTLAKGLERKLHAAGFDSVQEALGSATEN